MPRSVRVHQLSDLSNEECPNEVFIDVNQNTQLHISVDKHETVIWLPYGNSFDIIDGKIIIHDKR